MSKYQLIITGTAEEIKSALAKLECDGAPLPSVSHDLEIMNDDVPVLEDEAPAPAPKRGRKPRKPAPIVASDDLESLEDISEPAKAQADLEAWDDSADTAPLNDRKVNEAQTKQLRAALQNYSVARSRPEALAILHKFAPASNEVKARQLPAILKELKV